MQVNQIIRKREFRRDLGRRDSETSAVAGGEAGTEAPPKAQGFQHGLCFMRILFRICEKLPSDSACNVYTAMLLIHQNRGNTAVTIMLPLSLRRFTKSLQLTAEGTNYRCSHRSEEHRTNAGRVERLYVSSYQRLFMFSQQS